MPLMEARMPLRGTADELPRSLPDLADLHASLRTTPGHASLPPFNRAGADEPHHSHALRRRGHGDPGGGIAGIIRH